MRYRMTFFTLLLCPLLSFAAPLPKDPPKGMPQLVVQIKSIDEILGDTKHVLGKLPQDANVPSYDMVEQAGNMFLPGWREAIDAGKPLGGYVAVQNDVESSKPVLMVPVKEKDAFLEFMKFYFNDLAETEDAGIHSGTTKFIFSTVKIHFRLANDYAYITFQGPAPLQDATKLAKPGDLFLKDETALVALRLYLDGVPGETKKIVREFFDKIGDGGGLGWMELLLMGLVGATDPIDFGKRMRQFVDEAKWASLRLDFDRKTDQMSLQFNVVPRADTPLGKEVAAFKPLQSQMAGLLDGDTAAGMLLAHGNFGGLKLEEQIVDRLLSDALNMADLDGDESRRKLLTRALVNSLKVNEADVAVALKCDAGKETYTAVVAAKLNQPKLLSLAMIAYVAKLPKEKRDQFTLNAEKLEDGTQVHRLTLPNLNEPANKVFGKHELFFYEKNDRFYAALGGEAIKRLNESTKLKPREGPQLLVQVDPSRLIPLIKATDNDDIARAWGKAFPKSRSFRPIEGRVTGGTTLRVSYSADFVDWMRLVFMGR